MTPSFLVRLYIVQIALLRRVGVQDFVLSDSSGISLQSEQQKTIKEE